MPNASNGSLARLAGLTWRLGLYFAVLIGAVMALSKAAGPALHFLGIAISHTAGPPPAEGVLLGETLILVGASFATAIMLTLDRDWRMAILPASPTAVPHFVQGLLWGLAGVGATLGAIAYLGGYHVLGLALSGPALAYYVALWATAAFVNGLAENLGVLGYPLLRVARATGWGWAILLVATLFAAAHLANAGENPVGIASVFMIGAVLAVAVYLTQDLWLSVGIHAGGVFAEDFISSVPDSGVLYSGHLVVSRLDGPTWLSGGSAGPEGSVVAFPVFAAILALLCIVYRRRSTSPA